MRRDGGALLKPPLERPGGEKHIRIYCRVYVLVLASFRLLSLRFSVFYYLYPRFERALGWSYILVLVLVRKSTQTGWSDFSSVSMYHQIAIRSPLPLRDHPQSLDMRTVTVYIYIYISASTFSFAFSPPNGSPTHVLAGENNYKSAIFAAAILHP
jgi:hypothetical protein